jgi:hypothetical protein
MRHSTLTKLRRMEITMPLRGREQFLDDGARFRTRDSQLTASIVSRMMMKKTGTEKTFFAMTGNGGMGGGRRGGRKLSDKEISRDLLSD